MRWRRTALVDRLIELPSIYPRLKGVEMESVWALINAHRRDPSSWRTVWISRDGIVIDGISRLWAARELGLPSIRIEVHPEFLDLRGRAVALNQLYGRNLSIVDRMAEAHRIYENSPQLLTPQELERRLVLPSGSVVASLMDGQHFNPSGHI